MMTCHGNDFAFEEYKNGSILCRSPNLTCSYRPQNEWDWWATGITYSVASAVCGVALGQIIQWEWPRTRRIWNKCKNYCKADIERAEELAPLTH